MSASERKRSACRKANRQSFKPDLKKNFRENRNPKTAFIGGQ
jgi:hypothetical protein